MGRAIVYLRVSTEMQAERGTSLEAQELACLRKAAEIGAAVIATIRDEGVSGALYWSRPGIQEALQLIEAGKADCLICANLSRFSRDTEHQQAIRKRLNRAGAALHLCDMDVNDTPEGKLQFGVMGNFAEYERWKIVERLHNGRSKKAEKGLQPYRSSPPFGYRIPGGKELIRGECSEEEVGKYRILPEEAEIMRELYVRAAAGVSLRALTHWLTELGIKTKKGREKWYAGTVRGMLRNPCYKGTALVGKTEAILDEENRQAAGFKTRYIVRLRRQEDCIVIPIPAIVSEDLWEAVARRMETNRTQRAGNPGRRHLLTGLLLCPGCGDKMRVIRRGPTKYYACKQLRECSFRTYVRADAIEPVVIGGVKEIARHPDMLQAAVDAYVSLPKLKPARDAKEIRRELGALDCRERATAEAQIAGIEAGASPAVYAAVFREIADQRAKLKAQLAALATCCDPFTSMDAARIFAQSIADIEAVFETDLLTPAEQNAALSTVVAAVHIEETGYRIDLVSIPGSDLLYSVTCVTLQFKCPASAQPIAANGCARLPALGSASLFERLKTPRYLASCCASDLTN